MIVVFHGTKKEKLELLNALNKNCHCNYTDDYRTSTCIAHSMMTGDQVQLDHLVFGKRLKAQMEREEYGNLCPRSP